MESKCWDKIGTNGLWPREVDTIKHKSVDWGVYRGGDKQSMR